MHVILNDSALFDTPLSFTTGPIAPMQAFDAWLANPDPSPISYIGNAPGVD
jgi:hypothetical protein